MLGVVRVVCETVNDTAVALARRSIRLLEGATGVKLRAKIALVGNSSNNAMLS